MALFGLIARPASNSIEVTNSQTNQSPTPDRLVARDHTTLPSPVAEDSPVQSEPVLTVQEERNETPLSSITDEGGDSDNQFDDASETTPSPLVAAFTSAVNSGSESQINNEAPAEPRRPLNPFAPKASPLAFSFAMSQQIQAPAEKKTAKPPKNLLTLSSKLKKEAKLKLPESTARSGVLPRVFGGRIFGQSKSLMAASHKEKRELRFNIPVVQEEERDINDVRLDPLETKIKKLQAKFGYKVKEDQKKWQNVKAKLSDIEVPPQVEKAVAKAKKVFKKVVNQVPDKELFTVEDNSWISETTVVDLMTTMGTIIMADTPSQILTAIAGCALRLGWKNGTAEALQEYFRFETAALQKEVVKIRKDGKEKVPAECEGMRNDGPWTDMLVELRDMCFNARTSITNWEAVPAFKAVRAWGAVLAMLGLIGDRCDVTFEDIHLFSCSWTKSREGETTTAADLLTMACEAFEYSMDAAIIVDSGGSIRDLIVPDDVMSRHARLMAEGQRAQTGGGRMKKSINDYSQELRDHASKLWRLLNQSTGHEKAIYNRAYYETVNLAEFLDIKLFSSDLVPQAYCVMVQSNQPGTGKSYCQRVIASIMMGAGADNPLKREDRRLCIQSRSKYDNYDDATEVIICNDLGAIKPQYATDVDVHPGVYLLEKIDNTVKAANKADLPSKDRIFATLKGLVISCNDHRLNLHETNTCPEAPIRRITHGIEQSVIPEFQQEDGTFDTKKYREHQAECAANGKVPLEPNRVRMFKLYVTSTGKIERKFISDEMEPAQYYRLLVELVEEHRLNQQQYVNTLSQPLYVCEHGNASSYCPRCAAQHLAKQKGVQLVEGGDAEAEDQFFRYFMGKKMGIGTLAKYHDKLWFVPEGWHTDFLVKWTFALTYKMHFSFIWRIAAVLMMNLSIWLTLVIMMISSLQMPLLHKILLVEVVASLVTLWRTMAILAYVRKRLEEGITKIAFASVQGMKDYYADIRFKHFGPAALVMTGLTTIYKLWNMRAPKFEDQSALNPQTKEEVQLRREETNMWERVELKVESLPKVGSIVNMTKEMVVTAMVKNTVFISVGGKPARGIMPSTGRIITNLHVFQKMQELKIEQAKLKITRATHPDQHCSAFITKVIVLEGDKVELRMSSTFQVSDIDHLFTDDIPEVTAAELHTPLAGVENTVVRTFNWRLGKAAGEKMTFEGSQHEYNMPCSQGDCMSFVVSLNKPHYVIGVHCATSTGGVGQCCVVRKREVAYVRNDSAFDADTKTMRPALAGDFPEIVFGKPIYVPGPVSDRAVTRYAATASELRKDLKEVRQVVPDPGKMIGEESPMVQNYGGRLFRGRPHSSCVKRTLLSPFLERYKNFCKWGPPKVSKTLCHAMNFATTTHPMTAFSHWMVQWAIEDYVEPLLTEDRRDIYGNDVTPLTLDEAVNGRRGCKFVKMMNMKSSAGGNLSGSKTQHAEVQIGPNGSKTYKPKEYIEEKYYADMERYKKGFRCFPVSNTSMKDEPTPLTKEKGRIFNVLDWVYLLIGRTWFQPIVDYLLTFPLTSEMAVGLQTINHEWGELYKYLGAHDLPNGERWRTRVLEGDYSSYDQRITTQLLEAVGVIFLMHGEFFGYACSILVGMAMWFHDLARPFVNYDGVLVSFLGYNLSGNNLTIIINNLVNSLLFRMFYVHYYTSVLKVPLEDIPPFRSHVRAVFVGDDSLATTDLDWFNMRNYQAFLEMHGMPYTDANKNAEVAEFIRLEEATLCKRSFRVEGNRVYAPIALDSIFKQLHCWMDRGKTDELSVVPQNVDDALVELSRHGHSVWNAEIIAIRAAVYDAGISHMCKHFSKTFEEVREIADSYFAEVPIVEETDEEFSEDECEI